MANPKAVGGGEFKTPPSSKEVAAKANPAAEIARAHEKVFGEGSASLKGPNMPENWREGAPEEEKTPTDPKFIPDPGEAPAAPPEPVISEEEKSAFLRSILSGAPYRKSISLFGGKMHVVLRTRTATEAHEVVRASMADSNDYLLNIQMEMDKRHLAYALVSVEDDTGKILEYDNGEFKERLARIEAFPYPKYNLLRIEMSKFNQDVEYLTEKATQPGFWQPAAGI